MLRVASLALICYALAGAAEPAPSAPRVVITTNHGAITCELFPDKAPKTVANFLALAAGEKAFTDPVTGDEATRPFYDGLTFHRVIAGFMIQGGCPKGDGSGGPGYTFKDEINADSLGLDKTKALSDGKMHEQCAYMQQQFMQAVIDPLMRARGVTPATPKDEADAHFRQVLAEVDGITLKAFYEKLGYQYDANLPPSPAPVRGSLCMANSGPNTNGSQFFINLVDTPHLTGKHTVFGRVVDGMEIVDRIGLVEVDRATGTPRDPVVIETIRAVE